MALHFLGAAKTECNLPRIRQVRVCVLHGVGMSVRSCLFGIGVLSMITPAALSQTAPLPPLPPIPRAPSTMPIDTVPMGDTKGSAEIQLDLKIADGPFKPTWAWIEANYPGTPQWL